MNRERSKINTIGVVIGLVVIALVIFIIKAVKG